MKALLFFLFTLNIYASSINIAVAANVSYAMDELKKEFHKKYPDINVKVTLGGSGKLTAQIMHGAPYGVFMSADMLYPKALYKKGFALTQPRIYAKGALAMLSKKPRDFSKALEVLQEKSIQKIAIANPKTAPYGKASVEALKNANIYSAIKKKFIYAESISQTLSYIITAADIGIIAKSALFSKKLAHFQENRDFIEVDASFYEPIKQGIVLLKYAKNKKEYQLFYDFILSEGAQKIFQKYGYLKP